MVDIVKVQKLGKDLIIIIPTEICENLNIEEGLQVEMEPFTCSGEIGVRMKFKK